MDSRQPTSKGREGGRKEKGSKEDGRELAQDPWGIEATESES